MERAACALLEFDQGGVHTHGEHAELHSAAAHRSPIRGKGHRRPRPSGCSSRRGSGLRVRPAGIVVVGRERGFGIAATGVACLVRCWR